MKVIGVEVFIGARGCKYEVQKLECKKLKRGFR
jgi:hypothetical protein